MYPDSHIVSCSTAGEILGTTVSDDTISLTALQFEKTTLETVESTIDDPSESAELGKKLASELPSQGLVHVLVFSEGLKVNGTKLVEGLLSVFSKEVVVTGGLVGDGSDFKKTLVGLDKAPDSGRVVLVGFYGEHLKVGHGSLGGWDDFGVERTITRSENNVVFELDGKPALALYKEYLGDKADGLPGTGLLFPLLITEKKEDGSEEQVVRTLLAVDEDAQSMTFAGDMPTGAPAKLMKANFNRLVEGAAGAAKMTQLKNHVDAPEFALLISCVGRKLVLKERIEEETEAVKEILGSNARLAGFYSYGEISPVTATENQCRLHNQTMTITTYTEV